MDREIKFRGKEKESGEWLIGALIPNGKRPCIAPFGEGFHLEEVKPSTIGQFTGLTDSAGKEIYEGDILGTSDRVIGYVKGGVRGYCYDVVYINHPAGETKWTLYSTVVNDFPNSIEVIGNVFDNPELIPDQPTAI